MSLEEYTKITVDKFMGLYARGLVDDCPSDHSPACANVKFNRKGEVQTRDGYQLSFALGHAVKRMFVATFGHDENILLTCDGAGHIYRSDTGGVLLSIANMVDFAAINVYSYCLISPISGVSGANNPVYIWQNIAGTDTVPIRAAAGLPPSGSFSAVNSATAGNCDIGVHQFAVSFITNTGYTTQPGPASGGVFTAVTVNSTGGLCIDLSGIPTGPAGTVARQILVTQADLDVFYYAGGQINSSGLISWDGVIPNNTTTAITISFFDTDLAVSADSLFDLLPVIPAGNYGEAGAMTFYNGRVFYFGGEFCLVRATNAGSSESIDNVAGFIQIPDQFDGNIVRGTVTLQSILYFTKAFGIYSVTDNGSDPSSWAIFLVDAGVGSSSQGIGTINLTQPALTQNQVALMADFGGIYTFTGSITQPPLTWKIDDLWKNLVATTNITVTLNIAIDPYNKLIYVLAAGTTLLVGDYNDGLDAQNIKWTTYTFPVTPYAVGMMYIQDGTDFVYAIRLSSGNNIYKIEVNSGGNDMGTAINSYYSTYFLSPSLGALNIFRFIQSRVIFTGVLNLLITSQDSAFTLSPPAFTGGSNPGRDMLREFNFMDEKCSVQIGCNSGTNVFLLQRLNVFGKPRFNMRPQV